MSKDWPVITRGNKGESERSMKNCLIRLSRGRLYVLLFDNDMESHVTGKHEAGRCRIVESHDTDGIPFISVILSHGPKSNRGGKQRRRVFLSAKNITEMFARRENGSTQRSHGQILSQPDYKVRTNI